MDPLLYGTPQVSQFGQYLNDINYAVYTLGNAGITAANVKNAFSNRGMYAYGPGVPGYYGQPLGYYGQPAGFMSAPMDSTSLLGLVMVGVALFIALDD